MRWFKLNSLQLTGSWHLVSCFALEVAACFSWFLADQIVISWVLSICRFIILKYGFIQAFRDSLGCSHPPAFLRFLSASHLLPPLLAELLGWLWESKTYEEPALVLSAWLTALPQNQEQDNNLETAHHSMWTGMPNAATEDFISSHGYFTQTAAVQWASTTKE